MDELMSTDACTLPTTERPLRLAELDDLFRRAVVRTERQSLSARLLLRGEPGLREEVLDLTARESECCSFFEFTVEGADDELVLDIAVPPTRADILDGLVRRAGELTDAGR